MTKEQLKEFNGQNGKPAYIGYKGKVYDLSKSDFWPSGLHRGRFKAGEDLTDSIGMSPHGEKNVFRYEAIDILEDGTAANNQENNADTVVPNTEEMISDMDKKMMEKRAWYRKNHPHPKMIHFPIGMLAFAFFMQLFAIVLDMLGINSKMFTTAGYISSVTGTLFILPSVASGALSFYINYNGFANSTLKHKIVGSAILLVTCAIAIIIGRGEIFSDMYNPVKSIYTVFTLINMGIVTYIASNGGKLTWPEDKK